MYALNKSGKMTYFYYKHQQLQVLLSITNTEEGKRYERYPVLATFNIRMLNMLPEVIQLTYVSETEILKIVQNKP